MNFTGTRIIQTGRWALLFAACFVSACGSPKPVRQTELGPDTRLKVAEAAEAAGDDQLANAMYSTLATSAPQDAGLQLRSARALMRNGKLAQARDALSAALENNPGNDDLIRTLASIEIISGQSASAITKLDAILARKPDNVSALVNKAVALDLESRHGEAQILYYQALAEAPADPAARNDLALSLMLQGRLAEARDILAPIQREAGSIPRIRSTMAILDAASRGTGSRSQPFGQDSDGQIALLGQAISRAGGETSVAR